MHHFRGGSALVLRGDARVRNNSIYQLFEPRIAYRTCVFQQLGEELVDVFLGVREKIGQVDLLGLCEPKLQERKLRLVAIDFDTRVDLDEIVAADVLRGDIELIPHAGFDSTAAVAKLETQIGLALARVANFFFVNKEKSSDALFGVEIDDERRLHWPDCVPERLPNNRNFLWPFLDLVTSGVALTS